MFQKNGVLRVAFAGLMVLAVSGVSSAARADRLDRIYDDLVGGDMKKSVAAAKKLGRMKPPKALDALMETLLLGAPPKLAKALVKAVGNHGSPRSFELLAHYCRNRNETVRAAALRSLARIAKAKQKKRIFEVALRGLQDGASTVRVTAAKVLVQLKKQGLSEPLQRKAEDVLLRLLIRRKDQLTAKVALSHFGGVETARALAVNIKQKITVRIVTTLYAAFLKRSDFGPEPVRVWVVKTLSDLTSPEAIAALMDYVATSQGRATASVALARKVAER